MKTRVFEMRIMTALLATLIPVILMGQNDREYIRKGNRLYKKSEFAGSEGMYRKAQGMDKASPDAGFNLGDALYKQGKYGDAAGEFDRSKESYTDSLMRAESFYNLGNALLKDQKYKESIESYINSLKLKPDNTRAKYNLAYAQDQLKKQQEQQKEEEQKQDQKKPDENKDEEKQDQNDQDQEQKNEQQEGSMSREDAKRLLEALAAKEKMTQEKVKRDKAAAAKTRVIKNW